MNGEKVKREWLCYSLSSKNFTAVFANLLRLILKKIMLASVGYGDWKHAPRDLARHKSSNKHLSCLSTRDAEAGSGSGGNGPFSVEAEAEARKFYRFRFHIRGKNGGRKEIGSAIFRRRANRRSINIKK